MRHSAHRGEAYALTLAFTTFVLFQSFNVFNARCENPSAFNRQFFCNGKLWAVPGTVVALQALVVHWAPARANFDTEVLSAQDWWLAFAVTYSILLLDEGRKLILKLLQRSHRKPT